jgi:hypothetical protein
MDAIRILIDRLQSARNWTTSLIEDVEESKWFEAPGTQLGHVAWQIGHVASSQIILVHIRCFGREYAACAPAEYQMLFGRGSTPVANAAAYPPIPRIREFFARIHGECLEMIAKLPAPELEKPPGAEPHPMFTNKAGAIGMAAMHECFHAGQIALIRRLMGKSPLR